MSCLFLVGSQLRTARSGEQLSYQTFDLKHDVLTGMIGHAHETDFLSWSGRACGDSPAVRLSRRP
jgi:hypothetical protein